MTNHPRPRSRSREQDWGLFDLQFRGHLTLPFDYENENKTDFVSGADQLSPLPSANQGLTQRRSLNILPLTSFEAQL
jgi:hypothetical protein